MNHDNLRTRLLHLENAGHLTDNETTTLLHGLNALSEAKPNPTAGLPLGDSPGRTAAWPWTGMVWRFLGLLGCDHHVITERLTREDSARTCQRVRGSR